ncbi:MAG: hypothetical protein AAB116_00145 [Candidatus Poribacteria bacterium]
MKRLKWQIFLGLSLVILAGILHLIHYFIFRDARQLLFYMVDDIAFIPIQVLLVTLIINGFLNIREKRAKMQKLNMVIGTFFSVVGTRLLASLSTFNPNISDLAKLLIITGKWDDEKFSQVSKQLKTYEYVIEKQNGDLQELKAFLVGERNFLLGLLANPNLLEHNRFTDLLWAVFHLMEELAFQNDITQISDEDQNHILVDIKRAYTLLIYEWLEYMKHLKDSYPYLFALAMKTNSFRIYD